MCSLVGAFRTFTVYRVQIFFISFARSHPTPHRCNARPNQPFGKWSINMFCLVFWRSGILQPCRFHAGGFTVFELLLTPTKHFVKLENSRCTLHKATVCLTFQFRVGCTLLSLDWDEFCVFHVIMIFLLNPIKRVASYSNVFLSAQQPLSSSSRTLNLWWVTSLFPSFLF